MVGIVCEHPWNVIKLVEGRVYSEVLQARSQLEVTMGTQPIYTIHLYI